MFTRVGVVFFGWRDEKGSSDEFVAWCEATVVAVGFEGRGVGILEGEGYACAPAAFGVAGVEKEGVGWCGEDVGDGVVEG